MAISKDDAQHLFFVVNPVRFQYAEEKDPKKQPFTQYLAPIFKAFLDEATRMEVSLDTPVSVYSFGLPMKSQDRPNLASMWLETCSSLKPPDPGVNVDKCWLNNIRKNI